MGSCRLQRPYDGPACDDNTRNGIEGGVDCGGDPTDASYCGLCAIGASCTKDIDCAHECIKPDKTCADDCGICSDGGTVQECSASTDVVQIIHWRGESYLVGTAAVVQPADPTNPDFRLQENPTDYFIIDPANRNILACHPAA